jgi:molybdopterin molybdotransferase
MLDVAKERPAQSVSLPLDEAAGLVLAKPVAALRDQPPFNAAAMDGYAVTESGLGDHEITLEVIGESAAGHGFSGALKDGQAVRIFTGAPVPEGGAFVVPQENVERRGVEVLIHPRDQSGAYIRQRGVDFTSGTELLPAGVRLDPWRIGLLAAAGLGEANIHPRPRVAILSTGEELVQPGQLAGPDQIYDSGSPSIEALIRMWGAAAQKLTPAGDTLEAISGALAPVQAELIVTIGGASVGDHDLVKPALKALGLELVVESVAVRPGKPTWFGRLADGRLVLGLPGNPASALVCAELFLRPLINVLSGAEPGPRLVTARTEAPLAANGPREHWMRAVVTQGEDGMLRARPLRDQDSSLVTVYAAANALLMRPVGAEAAEIGAPVTVLLLDRL